MNSRATALVALMFLTSIWPKSTFASKPPASSSTSAVAGLPESTLDALEAFAASLEGKLGYALSERLDEIAASADYQELLLALREFLFDETENIHQALDEFELDDLPIKSPRLRPLAARTFAALVATFELIPEHLFEEWVAEYDQVIEAHGSLDAALDNLHAPARIRRYWRHIARGNVALMCLPFASDHEDLQLALFEHAAVGAETGLRFLAALSPDPARAAKYLHELRLDPIDLEALERRSQLLAEAQQDLREAREHLPGFRLPPDPNFES